MFELPDRLADTPLDPRRPLYVICRVGGRSAQVAAWLNQQGYDARNVEGGMLAWAGRRRPMTSESDTPPHVA